MAKSWLAGACDKNIRWLIGRVHLHKEHFIIVQIWLNSKDPLRSVLFIMLLRANLCALG